MIVGFRLISTGNWNHDRTERTSDRVLFDTLTGRSRNSRPSNPARCGFYCCGPTVYGLSHLGNARAALVPDVMVRFLRHQGYEVKYVRNITDIDDKIIAAQPGRGHARPQDVADKYAAEYQRDMAALSILDAGRRAAGQRPRAGDHRPGRGPRWPRVWPTTSTATSTTG